jgi:hypothetical protein
MAEIQLTPEQVNQFLADAILRSKIGEAVEVAVKDVVTKLSAQYNNPFTAVIEQEVRSLLIKEIRDNYSEKLSEQIRVSLKTLLTDTVVNEIILAALRQLRKGGRDE